MRYHTKIHGIEWNSVEVLMLSKWDILYGKLYIESKVTLKLNWITITVCHRYSNAKYLPCGYCITSSSNSFLFRIYKYLCNHQYTHCHTSCDNMSWNVGFKSINQRNWPTYINNFAQRIIPQAAIRYSMWSWLLWFWPDSMIWINMYVSNIAPYTYIQHTVKSLV